MNDFENSIFLKIREFSENFQFMKEKQKEKKRKENGKNKWKQKYPGEPRKEKKNIQAISVVQ